MKRSALTRKTPLRAKNGLAQKPLKKMSLDDLKAKGVVVKASSLSAPKKRMRVRAKNNEGWVSIAKEMWEKGDRSCEVCDAYLGDTFSPQFYHHLLHRGSYRKFKRDPRNLLQCCADHHTEAHEFTVEALATTEGPYQQRWALVWERMLMLRNEAHNITT